MPLAIAITGPGSPETMTLVDLPITEPGPGQARIRQSISGVNFVDIYVRTGLYPLPPGQTVLGFEGAGVVEADRLRRRGPQGRRSRRLCRSSPRKLCRRAHTACLSAGASCPTMSASGLPAVPCCAVSPPICCSTRFIHCNRANWVLVHAAAGGVGQIVTRWAKRLGANVDRHSRLGSQGGICL